MSLQPFNPVPNQTTHSDATSLINSNFVETEQRLASIEARQSQNTVTSVNGVATFDSSSILASKITITENTEIVISNATAGDSGIIIIREASPGGFGITSNHVVLGGSLSLFDFITPVTGVGTISWYYDGSEYLLYVSETT